MNLEQAIATIKDDGQVCGQFDDGHWFAFYDSYPGIRVRVTDLDEQGLINYARDVLRSYRVHEEQV